MSDELEDALFCLINHNTTLEDALSCLIDHNTTIVKAYHDLRAQLSEQAAKVVYMEKAEDEIVSIVKSLEQKLKAAEQKLKQVEEEKSKMMAHADIGLKVLRRAEKAEAELENGKCACRDGHYCKTEVAAQMAEVKSYRESCDLLTKENAELRAENASLLKQLDIYKSDVR